MTEQELRQKVVNIAASYYGCKESDGSHKKIIDLYNSHTPLACGYKVKYTDAWCSTFVSAVAIQSGLTGIIPTECSCERHIQLFKNIGCWQENDAYVPSPGDCIFYDWDDSGVGDCTGRADHIGIVVSVTGNVVKVIEGNMNNAVGYRNMKVNGKYIRGYGVPKYSAMATSRGVDATKPQTSTTGKYTVVAGDTLSKIAAKFGTTVDELTEINNIPDANMIRVGQVLYLSAAVAAIEKLAKVGVINTPDYWLRHYHELQNLDTLLIKAAGKITKAGSRTETPQEGINVLVAAGVINSPDYWLQNCTELQNLDALLCALGGAVR